MNAKLLKKVTGTMLGREKNTQDTTNKVTTNKVTETFLKRSEKPVKLELLM